MSNKLIVSDQDEVTEDRMGLIFQNPTAFSQYIERRAIQEKTECMNILLDFCERRSLDVDDITHLLSRPLKEKIKVEMIKVGMAKSTETSLEDF
jgi:hypothetical protein